MSVVAVRYDPLTASGNPQARAAREQADWLLSLEYEDLAARTIADYRRATNRALTMFPNKAFEDFTDGDLLHIAATWPKGSRRVRMAAFVSWFDWGYRTRRLDEDPMKRMPKIKRGGNKFIETFSEAEIERFYSLPVYDASLLAILIEGGLRKAEARNLRVSDFRPESLTDAPHGRLIVFDGKGSKDRVVPASRRLKEAIEEIKLFENLESSDYFWYTRNAGNGYSHTRRSRPIGETSFVSWWERVTEAAGVEYIKRNPKRNVRGRGNPHVTRHSFATRWLRRGGRLETLSLVMGHTSIRTTFDLYGHLDTRDVARDLALIEEYQD